MAFGIETMFSRGCARGPTAVQVGRQDEGDALQPDHHGHRLRLPGLGDADKLVGEVAVQVKVVAVVAPCVAWHVPCEEEEANRVQPGFGSVLGVLLDACIVHEGLYSVYACTVCM